MSLQFVLAGGLVMSVAAFAVGSWVTSRIEQGVVQNSGTVAALYIESLIPSQALIGAAGGDMSPAAREALHAAFTEGPLSARVVTYNVWGPNGEVLESYRPDLQGRVFEPTDALRQALAGTVVSQFETLQVEADDPGSTLGLPLLEVYVPIRDIGSGEVLAVVEFYQRAEDLVAELQQVRRDSWVLVLGIFAASGALLFIIVHAGGRLIGRQRAQLAAQLTESQALTARNDRLRARVAQAARRSTAQSEKIMQRIGQDLHDGVAQHLALASLRLEGAGLGPSKDADTVRDALSAAMTELRAISRGLALPDLATLDLAACAAQAVGDHNRSFGSGAVFRDETKALPEVAFAVKLAVYRFLQEALANASRHARASTITARLSGDDEQIEVRVTDDGVGFDPALEAGLREDGGQGLLGLADRAATLDGQIDIDTRKGAGTEIRLVLPLKEDAA